MVVRVEGGSVGPAMRVVVLEPDAVSEGGARL